MSAWWWVVWMVRTGKAAGPDTDDDLALAHAAGVVPTAEPADSGLAGEVEGWLRDRTPAPPPIVPGRDGPVRHGEPKPGRPEGRCVYPRGGEGGS